MFGFCQLQLFGEVRAHPLLKELLSRLGLGAEMRFDAPLGPFARNKEVLHLFSLLLRKHKAFVDLGFGLFLKEL